MISGLDYLTGQPAPMQGGLAAAAPVAFNPEEIQRQVEAFQQQQAASRALESQSNEALSRYIAEQAAGGTEVASTNLFQNTGPLGTSGVFGLPNFGPQFDPANPTASTGQVFRFDTGSQVGVPGASGEMEYRNAAPVVFQPGENYILTDGKGEKVLGNATTPEEMARLVDMSGNLPYGFQLFRGDAEGNFTPGTQLFNKVDPRADGLLGAIGNYGIPLAVSLLAGPLGPLATAGLAAGTAGVTKLTSGYTLKDALTSAAIAGATAGALKGITGPTNPLGLTPFGEASSQAASALGNIISGTAQAPASALGVFGGGDFINVIANRGGDALTTPLASLIGSGVTAAAPALGGLTQGSPPQQAANQDLPEVIAEASRFSDAVPTGALANLPDVIAQAIAQQSQPASQEQAPETTDDQIDILANRFPDAVPTGALANIPSVIAAELAFQAANQDLPEIKTEADRIREELKVPPLPFTPASLTVPQVPDLAVQPEVAPVDDDQIVVTAPPSDNILRDGFAPIAGIAGIGALSLGSVPPAPPPKTPLQKALTTGGRVLTGLSILGGLAGGGGNRNASGLGTGAAAIGTRASLDPVFGGQLPTAGGIFAPQSMAPRVMSDIDYERYGYGPARSFFENVPETPEQYRAALAANAPRPMETGAGTVGVPNFLSNFSPLATESAAATGSAALQAVRRLAPGVSDAQIEAFLATPEGADFLAAIQESQSEGGADFSVAPDSNNSFARGDVDLMDDSSLRSKNPKNEVTRGDVDLRDERYRNNSSLIQTADRREGRDFIRDPVTGRVIELDNNGFEIISPNANRNANRIPKMGRADPLIGYDGFARGGTMAVKGRGKPSRDSYAVNGAGTGRSDEIPALLSDGEYVIDAETVAMLGDGSGKAGAKRLDDLRVKIRKHKGRNLAKGRFSDNAKAPEKYLSGGRT